MDWRMSASLPGPFTGLEAVGHPRNRADRTMPGKDTVLRAPSTVKQPNSPINRGANQQRRYARRGDGMGKWHKSSYDDEALVEAIARGDEPCSQIAARLGMDRHCVAQIARGEARHDLWPRIRAARREVVKRGRVRGRALAERAVARLAKIIAPGSSAPPCVQCEASLDILQLAAGDRDRPRRRWRGCRR